MVAENEICGIKKGIICHRLNMAELRSNGNASFRRGFIGPSILMMMIVMSHICLPLASPFAVGTHASTASVSRPITGIRPSAGVSFDKSSDLFQSSSADNLDDSGEGSYKATLASELLFSYASPLVNEASKRELTTNDAFKIPAKKRMSSKVKELSSIYKKCRSRAQLKIEKLKQKGEDKANISERNALLAALLHHQRRTLVITGLLRLLNTAIQAFPAILLSRFLRLLESGEKYPASKAIFAAVTLVVVLSVKMITENQYFHGIVNCATQVRGTLSGLIFDKSLRLPGGVEGASVAEDGKANLGNGGILNLMQSDTSMLEQTTMQLHTIWDGPLQIAIYSTLLYRYLGPSVFWGMGVLLTVIPLNSLTLRRLTKMRKAEVEAKDSRTKRTSEAISNMKLLKLQAWENYFADDIRRYRKTELDRHASRGLVRAFNSAISNAVPAIVLLVTLTAYSKSGRPLLASKIFTAISLFNQLRFPLFFYPMLIDSIVNGKNALQRISSFLSNEEIPQYVQTLPPSKNGGRIEMQNGNFLWSSSSPGFDGKMQLQAAPALCEADINVGPGEIVAVVGSVGSGKTALIKALLGELAPVPKAVVDSSIASVSVDDSELGLLEKPSVITHGNVAYCSQESWLPKGTLRDSIVFGREFDEQRYLCALKDSGLDEDIIDESGPNSKADASRGVLSHDTDVGEGGSSLSGGQRARVALARALYSGDDTKVYLLDDPLAALDAAVGSTVFERMTDRLKKSGAATILVTNDPNIPRRCDRVVLMAKYSTASSSCSTIVDTGTYDELNARGHDLSSLSSFEVDNHRNNDKATDDFKKPVSRVVDESKNYHLQSPVNATNDDHIFISEKLGNETVSTQHADPDCVECMKGVNEYMAEKAIPVTPDVSEISDKESFLIHNLLEEKDDTTPSKIPEQKAEKKVEAEPLQPAKKLVSADDKMMKGAVPLSAYVTYLKSVRSPVMIAAMLLSYLVANGAQFYQQLVVSKWTEVAHDTAIGAALGSRHLNSLVVAAGVVSTFLWVRSFFTMKVGVRASSFLHNRMLRSVFKAPMSFFDATPSGQLLSRFGKEMETVDNALPDGISSVLYCFLQIALSAAALAGVITPGMFIPLSLVAMFYGKTMRRFRPAARDLKKGESRTRSPIYTHFGEALRGKEIIRSIPHSEQFWSRQHQRLTDSNLSVYYTVKSLDRWLSIRLETLGNILVFATAVASVFLTRADRLKAGSAGMGLTQAMSITSLLTWAVRCLTDLETNMMSMMRVKELTDLDSEVAFEPKKDKSSVGKQSLKSQMPEELENAGAALKSLYSDQFHSSTSPSTDAALVASGWPWRGNVEFNNVSMRYNEVTPLVLKNVNITVQPGTTLGVVGRTGSGKSSLLLTLFRLAEVEAGGNIKIDNIDIRSISLQTLRASLSIIPQDPVLFAGTLMYNLDATGKASEKDAWEALNAASPELAKQFRDAGTGLNTYITEGGKNLSSGQRQLICLARALLRKSKILVMDEATSSVDTQTDLQVQETIRREFVNNGVTVITVAHRLDTVLGYDKIAVLGDGNLIEYGSPAELLDVEGGELRRLVMQDRQNKQKGASIVNQVVV
mmetsp:Transcript_30339/g.45944  ORF Transcript_30339/g.45944 Transcript_30339/m.45944 type:complete len:1588 (-) Transcript_30339:395-5158(-)